MAVITSQTIRNARTVLNHFKAIYRPRAKYGRFVATKSRLMFLYNLSNSNAGTAIKYLLRAGVIERGIKKGNKHTYKFVSLQEHLDNGGSAVTYDNLTIEGRSYSFRGFVAPKEDKSNPNTPTYYNGMRTELWKATDEIIVADGSGMWEIIEGQTDWQRENTDGDQQPEPTPEPEQTPSASDATEYMNRVAEAALMGDWAQLQHFIEREAAIGGTENI